ncbi:MAG: alpha/beta hydrolase [Pseudomonadota bacterium]
MSDAAPYYKEITPGTDAPRASWIKASDGVRLRVGVWAAHTPQENGEAKGTVFLLPGRTEYVEKYSLVATEFAKHGLSSLAIDWRGQGIADRLVKDPMSGHVAHFNDYQLDLDAMLEHGGDMPKPWFILGHSMGGAIGLRAIMERSDFKAAVFSGPMWGIQTSAVMKPVMWSLCWLARAFGVDQLYPPTTTGAKSYIMTEPFETNGLTRAADMYQLMRDQLSAHPELQLGAPSFRWLYEALLEIRELVSSPVPNLPCLTIMGSEECIIRQDRVKARMANWPNGTLHIEPGGKHELLMEDGATRLRISHMLAEHYLNA